MVIRRKALIVMAALALCGLAFPGVEHSLADAPVAWVVNHVLANRVSQGDYYHANEVLIYAEPGYQTFDSITSIYFRESGRYEVRQSLFGPLEGGSEFVATRETRVTVTRYEPVVVVRNTWTVTLSTGTYILNIYVDGSPLDTFALPVSAMYTYR